jgi:hypothetical protein
MLLKVAAIIAMTISSVSTPAPQPTPKQLPKIEEPAKCKGRTFASAEEALQSGCCSWHGGVCGCSNGRKVCCDKTLSPSCKC